MNVVRAAFAVVLAVSTAATMITTASAKIRRPSDDDKLQAACYPDVQRLCGEAIPDEAKITACMQRQKAKISAECLNAYKATQAD